MKNDLDLLLGKTVAISGASGGLGQELCFLLAKGGAKLVLIDRNEEKQRSFMSELNSRFPKTEVCGLIADMEDMASVYELEKELENVQLDYLILNAGAYSIPRHTASTGYDNVFQINFVSPYYLARRLLPSIRQRGGKIVAVGSIAHNYSRVDASDIDFSTRRKSSKVYGNSKRYLMYSLLSLAEQGEPIAVAHPGITFTGITAHYPKPIFAIIKYPMKIIFMKPKKACQSIYQALFEDTQGFSWIGPRFFTIWGGPKVSKLKSVSNDEIALIVKKSEEIYNSLDG